MLARGERLLAERRVLQARDAFLDARELGAEFDATAAHLWQCAMLLGRFEDAWQIGDAVLARRHRLRLSCADQPLHLQWVWDGTPLAGRDVVVRCHHGLGDAIQFVRLLRRLRPVARRVHLQVPPALLGLFSSLRDVDRLSPLDAPPGGGVAVELLELAHALRLDLSDIPAEVPYLPAPIHRPADGLRVGLVWAAGSWKPERSVPLDLLARLQGISGVRFVTLQRGPGLDELGRGNDPLHLYGTGQGTDDLKATVDFLGGIDLVITVDTMMAHLAGALGMPVWTLLHFEADWRWLAHGARSPWYPTMRLLRQRQPGAWSPVVDRLAALLRRSGRR